MILSKDAQGWKVGDYVALNNVWGKGSLVNGVDFTQSVTFDTTSINGGITFNWAWPKGGLNVVAYPEIVWGDTPLYDGAEECHAHVSKISDLTAFNVDLDVTAAAGSQYWNVSFDMWLTNKALGDASSITTELMVWLDKTATPWGTKVATIGTGGDTASVYFVDDVKSGARVWDYISVVYDTPHLSGEVDLKSILNELAKKGLVDSSNYVSGYNIGAEIRGGSGSLQINKLETEFTTAPAVIDGKDLMGTSGNDKLTGGVAGDTIEGAAGKDKLNGAGGVDTLEYSTSTSGVKVDLLTDGARGGHAAGDVIRNFENLTGSNYGDVLSGTDNSNVLQGLAGNDTINGRGGNDTIDGGAGNDVLNGGDGADSIKGDVGNDRITGGMGADQLWGGAGVDWFVFRNGESTLSGRDHIYDFVFSQGDRLDLVNVDGDTVTRGYQRFSFLGTGEFTGHAGELRYENTSTQTFVYADTDGDKKADLAIEMDGVMAVNTSYFVL